MADDSLHISTFAGSTYLRELENAHAVDVGQRAATEQEAMDRAKTILRNAARLGMNRERAAELAVIVLMSWQSRETLGLEPPSNVIRLWDLPGA